MRWLRLRIMPRPKLDGCQTCLHIECKALLLFGCFVEGWFDALRMLWLKAVALAPWAFYLKEQHCYFMGAFL